jgi:23S rRNA pseudouridine2457 synthase
MLLAFNKPYGVLSRFTPDGSPHRTLQNVGFPKNVYPIGRLDADSEGLLLLSDEPEWNSRLLSGGHEREYWVQVERIPAESALKMLELGIVIQGRKTLPCKVSILNPQPTILPRNPPIRYRKTVPDCWITMVLREGKNRQVRRMTAAVEHPTLRLIRVRIGELRLGELAVGQWQRVG